MPRDSSRVLLGFPLHWPSLLSTSMAPSGLLAQHGHRVRVVPTSQKHQNLPPSSSFFHHLYHTQNPISFFVNTPAPVFPGWQVLRHLFHKLKVHVKCCDRMVIIPFQFLLLWAGMFFDPQTSRDVNLVEDLDYWITRSIIIKQAFDQVLIAWTGGPHPRSFSPGTWICPAMVWLPAGAGDRRAQTSPARMQGDILPFRHWSQWLVQHSHTTHCRASSSQYARAENPFRH